MMASQYKKDGQKLWSLVKGQKKKGIISFTRHLLEITLYIIVYITINIY